MLSIYVNVRKQRERERERESQGGACLTDNVKGMVPASPANAAVRDFQLYIQQLIQLLLYIARDASIPSWPMWVTLVI